MTRRAVDLFVTNNIKKGLIEISETQLLRVRWAGARIKDWSHWGAAVVGPKNSYAERASSETKQESRVLKLTWSLLLSTGTSLIAQGMVQLGEHRVPILGVGAECGPSNAAGV